MVPQPRANRQPRAAKAKVNLNKYYSSGRPAGAGPSPFSRRQAGGGRRRRWLGRLLDLALLAVLAAATVYSLKINPNPQVSVTDTSYHSVNIYRDEATKQFASLKNKNKLTLDQQGISEALKKRFPEIAAVSLELPWLTQTPKINLQISAPALFLNSQGKLYVIDTKGRAVSSSADLPNVQGLSIVDDQSGFSNEAGRQVLSASEVSFIDSLIRQSKYAGVPISSLSLPAKPEQLDLRTADSAYYVKFYLGGDSATQIGQFLATRAQFANDGTQPSEYLDVRVQGKIFYR